MKCHTTELARRLRWGAIAVGLVATVAVGTAAASGDEPTERDDVPTVGDAPADAYSTCVRAGAMVPDRVTERAEACRLRLEQLYTDRIYVDCMQGAATTPDAMERWVDFCLALAQR